MMLSFLYEQYGYYPQDIIDGVFVIANWKFKLIQFDGENNYIDMIEEFVNENRYKFDDIGPYIIKTRNGEKVSIYDGKKYVLICIFLRKVNLEDLNKFHCLFIDNNKEVNLKKVAVAWEYRISIIEKEAINSLRVDSVYYKANLELAMFSLGMAQNALQYLSELIEDYGQELKNVTLSHKRIYNLDSFEFLNPFNYIVDHPIRDYVELYKKDIIDFDDLAKIMTYYNFDSKLASLFLARMFYPIEILDSLEANIVKKDLNYRIRNNIEKEIEKIKKIYTYLRSVYNIRPVNWLE